MFFYLLCVILLTASPVVECQQGGKKDFKFAPLVSWPADCLNHPLAVAAKAYNADEKDKDAPVVCGLKIPATLEVSKAYKLYHKEPKGIKRQIMHMTYFEKATPFCASMFYGKATAGPDVDLDHMTLGCVYERYQYCPEGHWAFNGNCYALNSQKMTKLEAIKTCGYLDDGKLLSGIEAAHWLKKLNVLEKLRIETVWMRESTDSYIDSDKQGGESSHAVYRFLPDPVTNHRAGYVEAAAKDDKHASICIHNAKQYLHSYKEACEIINREFKIPSAYLNGTCYTQSTNFHIADAPLPNTNDLISVKHFHKACSVLGDATSYAVAPTSGVKKQAMRMVMNASDYTRNDITLIPGQRQAGDVAYDTRDSAATKREKLIIKYEYVVDSNGTDREPIFRYAWRKDFPTDYEGDEIKWAAVRMSNEDANWGHKSYDIQVENTPSFTRGRLICANGFVKEDMRDMGACENGWDASAREEGNVVCHKAYEMRDFSYFEAKAVCKKDNAALSPIQSYREQLIVSNLALKVFSKSQVGAAWIGATRELATPLNAIKFKWDMDDQPMDYNNWDNNEPNDYDQYIKLKNGSTVRTREPCVQMFLDATTAGKWNDIPCEGIQEREKYKIVAGVCAKTAKTEGGKSTEESKNDGQGKGKGGNNNGKS